MKNILLISILTFTLSFGYAQKFSIVGRLISEGQAVEFATVTLKGTTTGTVSNENGVFKFNNLSEGKYELICSAIGYERFSKEITIQKTSIDLGDLKLKQNTHIFDEVVISGTMKEVSRKDSPVAVEVFTSKFFKANPSPSLFSTLQNINGVRPQVNCNVCNTGDIHINGLDGPYTMIMIDGMPMVSGLSTVYGLSGIPEALIDRLEVVKGPASTLYGSEAVGGLINIITKSPMNAPIFSADVFTTSWGELNVDLGGKFNAGKKAVSLLGVNVFNYQNPIDKNGDNFTDLTLQQRASLFNKWTFKQKNNKQFNVAGRVIFEDRWGGEINWTKAYRGGDEVYGESIYTKRWEVFGNYQLPIKEDVTLMFSANDHHQDSRYGTTDYQARQQIVFAQLVWKKTLNKHDLLTGLANRYTYYKDNSVVSFEDNVTPTNRTHLPGIFVQDEFKINSRNTLLMGIRYDYNAVHGNIFSPRINYKWSSLSKNTTIRMGFGNGYRVANVFTEDHAALTGARKVVFTEELKPEKSWNANLNMTKQFYFAKGTYLNLDATAFYTYFNNRIIPDYTTDVNKVIYANLDGHAVSKGLSLNLDLALPNGITARVGGTILDVYKKENEVKEHQLFTERFTGTWALAYTFKKMGLTVDYTGNLYGPMDLPLLGDLDPRPSKSPTWSIQNIQLTQDFGTKWEVYGGVKNLLNWTPTKGVPFIISRANDPFDKNVKFDEQGKALPTPRNPYSLTFDPNYVYAPNQGLHGFLGVRFSL